MRVLRIHIVLTENVLTYNVHRNTGSISWHWITVTHRILPFLNCMLSCYAMYTRQGKTIR
jgi:hypothetical protein